MKLIRKIENNSYVYFSRQNKYIEKHACLLFNYIFLLFRLIKIETYKKTHILVYSN